MPRREEPVLRVLRAEAGYAARQGAVTALAVVVVLLVAGAGTPPAAAAADAGFVSAVVVHQAVLLAVAVLRWRADSRGATAPATARAGTRGTE